MTEQELVENNNLINEFMGLKDDIPHDHQGITPYHSDWNWLIPVVYKIYKLGFIVIFYGNHCNIMDKNLFTKKSNDGLDIEEYSTSIDTLIDAVYLCVIKFIKWYSDKNK